MQVPELVSSPRHCCTTGSWQLSSWPAQRTRNLEKFLLFACFGDSKQILLKSTLDLSCNACLCLIAMNQRYNFSLLVEAGPFGHTSSIFTTCPARDAILVLRLQLPSLREMTNPTVFAGARLCHLLRVCRGECRASSASWRLGFSLSLHAVEQELVQRRSHLRRLPCSTMSPATCTTLRCPYRNLPYCLQPHAAKALRRALSMPRCFSGPVSNSEVILRGPMGLS